jgi:hypothetical protein
VSLSIRNYRLRITFLTPVLGSQPGRNDPSSKYIRDKARKDHPELEIPEDEVESLSDELDKGTTGFYRGVDGRPIFKSYQCKGFLKECADALNGIKVGNAELKALRNKIEKAVFVSPIDLPIQNVTYHPTADNDKALPVLERPLRCMTMRGPRTSLARSEMINEAAWFTCNIQVVELPKINITEQLLRDILDYGTLNGFSAWRGSGVYGKIKYELTPLSGNEQ